MEKNDYFPIYSSGLLLGILEVGLHIQRMIERLPHTFNTKLAAIRKTMYYISRKNRLRSST